MFYTFSNIIMEQQQRAKHWLLLDVLVCLSGSNIQLRPGWNAARYPVQCTRMVGGGTCMNLYFTSLSFSTCPGQGNRRMHKTKMKKDEKHKNTNVTR